MAELTKELEQVLKDAGMGGDACWKHKQSGKWVIYHWACEKLADHFKIGFPNPTILESRASESVALLISGSNANGEYAWSIGEASPQNNKNPYPYAMAEKRGKDRVILKLVGLHGLAYSEEEADDFKQGVSPHADPPVEKYVGVTALKARAREMGADLASVSDDDELTGFLTGYATLMNELKKELPDWHKAALDAVDGKRESFKQILGAG